MATLVLLVFNVYLLIHFYISLLILGVPRVCSSSFQPGQCPAAAGQTPRGSHALQRGHQVCKYWQAANLGVYQLKKKNGLIDVYELLMHSKPSILHCFSLSYTESAPHLLMLTLIWATLWKKCKTCRGRCSATLVPSRSTLPLLTPTATWPQFTRLEHFLHFCLLVEMLPKSELLVLFTALC